MGIIELIIIVWVIAAIVKKNQKNGRSGIPNQPNIPSTKTIVRENVEKTVKKGYQTVIQQAQNHTATVKQEELKRRLKEKYAGDTGENKSEKAKPDILKRAAAHVEEDFKNEDLSRKPVEPPNISKIEKRTKEQAVQETDSTVEIALYKTYDILQMQQESELMKQVSDVMVKGVEIAPNFQRDFVAEGIDMINRMTL